MKSSRLKRRVAVAATLAIVALLLLVRIADFGIWDPWELATADLARQIVEAD